MQKWEFSKIFASLISPKAALAAASLIVLASVGLAGYFYSRLAAVKQDPQSIQAAELKEVLESVGKLIVLPQGEEPTLATVTDPEKLTDQPFFAQAKTGYKVLIYTNAKKAILYDPFEDKIVEVAPVNIGNSPSPSPEVLADDASPDKSQVSVKVLNGSGKAGLAQKVSDLLKRQGYVLVSIGDAPAGSKTTSISYNPKDSAHASSINQLIKGQAITQEQDSAAGITLILGSDFVE